MGLDMYLYKVNKIDKETAQRFNGIHSEDLPNKYVYYDKRTIEERPDMYSDLLPYMQPIKLRLDFYNIEKLKKDNNIPEEAELGGSSYSADKTTFSFYWGNEIKKVEFKEEEYTYTKETEVYLCEKEEVYYWRKEYDIRNMIYEAYGKPIKNCGYYLLPENIVLSVVGEYYNGGKENIFYHEWY